MYFQANACNAKLTWRFLRTKILNIASADMHVSSLQLPISASCIYVYHDQTA